MSLDYLLLSWMWNYHWTLDILSQTKSANQISPFSHWLSSSLDCIEALLLTEEVDKRQEHPWSSELVSTLGVNALLQWAAIWITETFSLFSLNLSWPDFCSTAKGVWLFYCWAHRDKSGMCKTLQMKLQDFFQSFLLLLSGNQWCTTYWRWTPGYKVFILPDSSATVFFPLPIVVNGYMNLNCNFPAHKNILTRICTRPCLFLSFLLKQTLRLIKVHEVLCPKNEDYSFCHEQFCFSFFPSPLNIFARFFCSQSSVSLDCIWNYRSSYHSLKRLVCPALCI